MVKNRKIERNHWIPLIQISIGTKLQLELTILIFLTRFTPALTKNFEFFDQICPKGIFLV